MPPNRLASTGSAEAVQCATRGVNEPVNGAASDPANPAYSPDIVKAINRYLRMETPVNATRFSLSRMP